MNLMLPTCWNERAEWEKRLKRISSNAFEEQPKVKEMPWSGMGNLQADITHTSMKKSCENTGIDKMMTQLFLNSNCLAWVMVVLVWVFMMLL